MVDENKVLLKEIEKYAKENKVPIMQKDGIKFLTNYVQEQGVKSILEVGTAIGYSAICMALVDPKIKITTIERDEERIAEAKENIKKVGVEEKINIYEGDAVEILPTMNDKYDVVFIDAAKGKYPFFLEHALRMLKDDGIIFADNVLYKGYVMSDYNKHKQRTAVTHLRQYIKETTENPELETEILEVGDGLAITKKRIEK